ncbi:aromatic-ring-hydroxylating dioxygenase subunit beta [uncultured Neptuniibacter sp.]|uniref:aromatic-ring-hydroxylating dioxygenase subunit beta n=1 Tax=uncultured Neptuniibacter sp. TaxID=502143 RepID=UPI002629B566|nr:aromatic-ring-hydroxylating dioxygenase subunit beta [uncultured Neptuniibacter sp.]
MSDLNLLNRVRAFIDTEADMLDFEEYNAWLDLWTDNGVYVVPIDPKETDFANTLNYAYDKAEMRKLRVARLQSGEAVSTQTTEKTVRQLGRFRILAESDTHVEVRCSMYLSECRHGNLKTYPADVTYKLLKADDEFRIDEKVIRLQNSDAYLSSIGYIL